MNTEKKIIQIFLIAGNVSLKSAKNQLIEIGDWLGDEDLEKIDYLSDYKRYSADLKEADTRSFVKKIADVLYEETIKENSIHLKIIWCLIYLASKQKTISKHQQAILGSLAEEWNINKSIWAEFIDTAETIKELSAYNEQLIQRKMDIEQKEIIINEAEKSRLKLLDNIKRTLLEAEDM